MDETTKSELERLWDEDRRQNRRLDMLEQHTEMQQQITIAVEKLALSMEQMLKNQEKHGSRLDVLERAPGEQWNSMKRTIFNTIVGAEAGAFATGLLYVMAMLN